MAIVTLADMKAHLGIVDDADDALISDKIDAAQAWLEQMLGYSIEEEFPSEDSPAAYPADLVEAIKQQAAHMFENREATLVGVSIVETPAAVADTIRNRRAYTWGADGS